MSNLHIFNLPAAEARLTTGTLAANKTNTPNTRGVSSTHDPETVRRLETCRLGLHDVRMMRLQSVTGEAFGVAPKLSGAMLLDLSASEVVTSEEATGPSFRIGNYVHEVCLTFRYVRTRRRSYVLDGR